MKKKITVISSFAIDKFIDKKGNFLAKKKGGPAFFLKKVFDEERIDYILKSGPKMEVILPLNKKGEIGPGKVFPRPLSQKIDWKKIETPFLLVSTLLDEFDLRNLSDYKGKIFFDIQGYVRNKEGRAKKWNPRKRIINHIFCLKGTREEFKNLPKKAINSQKKRVLIITKERKGSEIFVFGKRYLVQPSRVVEAKDRLGAGDTFFAYFISHFIKKEKIVESVYYATEKTSKFLLRKKSGFLKNHFTKEKLLFKIKE